MSPLLVSLLAGCAVPTDYAALPLPLNAMGAAVLDDTLYVHGGHTGGAHDHTLETIFGELWTLDLADAGADWVEHEAPTVPVQQSALLAHDGLLYRLGGLSPTSASDDDNDLFSLDEVASYDPATEQWTDLPPMPEALASHAVHVVGDVLHVVGGWVLEVDVEDNVYTDKWYTLDLLDREAEWATHTAPFQIRDHCIGMAGDRLVSAGGMDQDSGMPKTTWLLDPDNREWSEGPELPSSGVMKAFGCGGTSVDDVFYINNTNGRLWSLGADQAEWVEFADLETPRNFHRLVERDSTELIAVGGAKMGGLKAIDSVESIPLD